MQIGVRLELLIGLSSAASHGEEKKITKKKKVVCGFIFPYSAEQTEK